MDHAKEQNMLNMEQRNRNQKRRGGFQRRNFNDGGRDSRDNRDNRDGNRHFNNRGNGNGRRAFN